VRSLRGVGKKVRRNRLKRFVPAGDLLRSAADFEPMAVGVLKEDGVVPGAFGEIRPFHRIRVNAAQSVGDAIDLVVRHCNEGDAIGVGLRRGVDGKAEPLEIGRTAREVRTWAIRSVHIRRPRVAVACPSQESERAEHFVVESDRPLPVADANVDVRKQRTWHSPSVLRARCGSGSLWAALEDAFANDDRGSTRASTRRYARSFGVALVLRGVQEASADVPRSILFLAEMAITLATAPAEWRETVPHAFSGVPGDGRYPLAKATMAADGRLYTVTLSGGPSDNGTVVELVPPASKTRRWTERAIHAFGGDPDGSAPFAGVVVDRAGSVFGTTYQGGGAGNAGTVFRLTPAATPGGVWRETILHAFKGLTAQIPPAISSSTRAVRCMERLKPAATIRALLRRRSPGV